MNDYREQQAEKRRQERIKRAKRKNMIIYIESLLIIILSVALIAVSIKYVGISKKINGSQSDVTLPNTTQSGGEQLVSSGMDVPDTSSADTSSADAMKAELDQWYMKLVNPDISVSTDFINSVDLAEINEKYTSGSQSSKYLDSRIVETFNTMCKDAAKDGVTLMAVSSYRTYAYQQSLYNKRVQRCINEGLSEEAAKKKAATIVALPGTSEHHLGLAVDINSVEESFENTDAFRWLQKNAENYGFILRYPKDKQNITKIIYEPWHYRYVGVEHAKAINSLGMCLEEYVEYLSNGGVKK